MRYQSLALLCCLFLFVNNLIAQNCGCCHLDDCPCISDCESITKEKKNIRKERLPPVPKRNLKLNKISVVKSDVSGILIIENKVYSIQKGMNNIPEIQFKDAVPFEFQQSNGFRVSNVITGKKIKSKTFNLQLSADLSNQKIETETQQLIRIINQVFVKIPNSINQAEICQTEVPIIWYQTFVNATSFQTDAEKKGHSIVRVIHGKGDKIKPDVNWRHTPTGSIQSDLTHPVIHVSWNDAKAFCEWLSGIDENYNYRLPTLKEWKLITGADLQNFEKYYSLYIKDDFSNLADSSLLDLIPYKRKIVNPYGDKIPLTAKCGTYKCINKIYDIIGNVAEWIEDNPLPHTPNAHKIFIGGSYFSNFEECLTPYFQKKDSSLPGVGFRLVRYLK